MQSTIVQYMDDIYLSAQLKRKQDSITVLKALANEVEYLGRRLCRNQRKVASSHIEAITEIPKPQKVGLMLSF